MSFENIFKEIQGHLNIYSIDSRELLENIFE